MTGVSTAVKRRHAVDKGHQYHEEWEKIDDLTIGGSLSAGTPRRAAPLGEPDFSMLFIRW
jgi:hypothetical protein